MADDLTPFQLAEQTFTDAWPFWQPKIAATDELARFLSGERYVDDNGEFVKDRRGVEIVGQEISDTNRHVVAKITEKQRSVEVRPKTGAALPLLGEIMSGIISDELADPYKGFERERYMAIQAAQDGRRGCVWIDVVEHFGAFGSEMVYQFQPNGSYIYDPEYHPHHPLSGWASRDKRLDYRAANRIYGVDWLKPDSETAGRDGAPQWRDYTKRAAGYRDNRVTIRELWIKNDPTVDDSRPARTNRRKLAPNERYMQCADQCGYRSLTQGRLRDRGMRAALPDMVPAASEDAQGDGCPMCHGALERIDAVDTSEDFLLYTKGRRLIVVAPFCPGTGKKQHLYDGDWLIPGLRSYPAYFTFATVKPGDNSGGQCNVDTMWRWQVASDNLATIAVQRVFEHRDYMVTPDTGFYNAAGKRFERRDDDENMIFRDMRKTRELGPTGGLQIINGTGLDPSWGGVYDRGQTALLQFRAKADIGVNPATGEGQDAAVGTTELRVQQSEVSTDDFKRRDNQELSMTYGCVEDLVRATYTRERLARLNIDGIDQVIAMWGDAMPAHDYAVSESPTFTGLDKQRQAAWDAGMQVVAQLGPDALEPWGKFHNVPPSVVRDLQKFFEARAAKLSEQGGMPPNGMGATDAPPAGSAGGDGSPAMMAPASSARPVAMPQAA